MFSNSYGNKTIWTGIDFDNESHMTVWLQPFVCLLVKYPISYGDLQNAVKVLASTIDWCGRKHAIRIEN